MHAKFAPVFIQLDEKKGVRINQHQCVCRGGVYVCVCEGVGACVCARACDVGAMC